MNDYIDEQIVQRLSDFNVIDIGLYHEWKWNLYDFDTEEPIDEKWNQYTLDEMNEILQDHPNAYRIRDDYYYDDGVDYF